MKVSQTAHKLLKKKRLYGCPGIPTGFRFQPEECRSRAESLCLIPIAR